MKISIAMATYNGAEFLDEQLQSFLTQTRLPDELVVCDDRSIDGTMCKLRRYAESAPFPVHVYSNKKQLGVTANFEKAISLCTGDLVFLSDQDDVWLPPRLKIVAAVFRQPDAPNVVINDAELIDGRGIHLGLTKAGQARAAGLPRPDPTGCCTAFTRGFANVFLPVPKGVGNHDSWLHALAVALGERLDIPDVLQLYRRHGGNASASLSSRTIRVSRWLRYKTVLSVADYGGSLEQKLFGIEAQMERLQSRTMVLVDELGYTPARLERSVEDLGWERVLLSWRLDVRRTALLKRMIAVPRLWRAGAYGRKEAWGRAIRDVFLV